MRTEDGENRTRNSGENRRPPRSAARTGAEGKERRNSAENHARKTNPEVAGRGRRNVEERRIPVSGESTRRVRQSAAGTEPGRMTASEDIGHVRTAGDMPPEISLPRTRARSSEAAKAAPSDRMQRSAAGARTAKPGGGAPERPANMPGSADKQSRRPGAERKVPPAGQRAAKAPEEDLFDDLSIEDDILGDSGMEDKIFSRAMEDGSGSGRKKPRELNTAKTIIDQEEYSSKKQAKKKLRIRKIIIFAVLEVLTLCFIFGYAYFARIWNSIERPEFNKAAVENNNIDITKKEAMQGYWTFAVFGVDSRGSGVGKGYNSDVIMLVSINKDTGDIKICSVFRDTYLNISDGNRYAKINEAYAAGGPEQAVKALNKNLDLNIESYVTFNWKAVAESINILGGVDDIDISKAELYYINAYITETVKATGIGSVQLKSTGPQHLDGVQAVAYARLRYMDNDFARTERQREILKACFDKAKDADFAVLNNIIVVLADQVATNISPSEMVSLAQGIAKYNIADTGGFPWSRGDANIPGKGACVIPTSLESNVQMLHEFLYGDEDYQVSSAVLSYSNKIKQDSNLYKEGTPIESVGTDGGYIPTSHARTEDDDEDDTSETKERETRFELETDEDGNVILPTDENGVVYPTDEDGNVVLPTDDDGRYIMPSTSASGRETRPSELATEIETGNDNGSDIVGPDGDRMPTLPGSGTGGHSGGTTGTSSPGGVNPTGTSADNGNSGPGSGSGTVNPTSETTRPSQVVNPTMETTRPSASTGGPGGTTSSEGPGSQGPSGTSAAPSGTSASPLNPGLTGGPGAVSAYPGAA